MEYIIKGYDSTALRYFEEISAIPRASGNEQAVTDYIAQFAKAHGLAYYRDEASNILVWKNATAGRENEDVLLLQAHTDMVAEKNADSTHDFTRDGIRLVQEGNILRADGTTLGADDGFGVALMLAALSECEDHPPLECLFTATEETGLCGAVRFDYSRVRSKKLINLDSAEESDIIIGCCGGYRNNMACDVTEESAEGMGISVVVSGLCGGHSGEDIHRGRANAIAILRRLIARVQGEMPVRIARIGGGSRENVIPREASALISVEDTARAMALLQAECEACRADCRAEEDAGLCFVLSLSPFTSLLTEEDTARVLHLLSIPHGVLAWREEGKSAYLSRNLASVCLKNGVVTVGLSTRCPKTESLDKSNEDIAAFAARVGARFLPISTYCGWESDEGIDLVREWRDAYRAVTGEDMRVTVIHAGLECGVICGSVPGMDAIAIGCNIHNLHSPDECMELDSFVRVENTLRTYLAK